MVDVGPAWLAWLRSFYLDTFLRSNADARPQVTPPSTSLSLLAVMQQSVQSAWSISMFFQAMVSMGLHKTILVFHLAIDILRPWPLNMFQ